MLTHARLSILLDVLFPFVETQLHVLQMLELMLFSTSIANLRYLYFQSLRMMIHSLEGCRAGSRISLGTPEEVFHGAHHPLPREAIQLAMVMIEATTEAPA
jgi:hypothetical protein